MTKTILSEIKPLEHGHLNIFALRDIEQVNQLLSRIAIDLGWMDDSRFHVLFNSISGISGR